MNLKTFIDKYHLSDTLSLDHIAISHPETREKIYIISQWFSGIWFRKIKGSANSNGQMWPLQWIKDIGDLEVHKDAKKELGIKQKKHL